MHTRWIETDFDNTIEPWSGTGTDTPEAAERQTVVVEVGGKRLEVTLPAGFTAGGGAGPVARHVRRHPAAAAAPPPAPRPPATPSPLPCRAPSSRSPSRTAPPWPQGDLVVVLEAMKMEQPITAHKAGTISRLTATVGATVTNGAVLCDITDPEG